MFPPRVSPRALNLDDLGSLVRQQHPQQGPGHIVSGVEHAHPAQSALGCWCRTLADGHARPGSGSLTQISWGGFYPGPHAPVNRGSGKMVRKDLAVIEDGEYFLTRRGLEAPIYMAQPQVVRRQRSVGRRRTYRPYARRRYYR